MADLSYLLEISVTVGAHPINFHVMSIAAECSRINSLGPTPASTNSNVHQNVKVLIERPVRRDPIIIWNKLVKYLAINGETNVICLPINLKYIPV